MNAPRDLIIGVIGGLGPAATHDFFGKVLHHSSAQEDGEHLHLIINNNPKVPDRNHAIAGTGPSSGPVLAAMAKVLERAGADLLVMACNTAHAFEGDIRAAVRIPFVSLINEVVSDIKRNHPKARCVGLLATKGCVESGIYRAAFRRLCIDVIHLDPASQNKFMTLLYRIKSGARGRSVKMSMQQLGETLAADGADVLVAGCTEVPLVLTTRNCSIPVVDSTDVLARRCVVYARRIESLPTSKASPSNDRK